MAITRHSLRTWQEPLAEAVARHLIAAVRANGQCVDLRAHRVVVPSQYAARLIREQLARQAPEGVLPPQFQTPNDFLNLGYREDQVASSTDELMAWIEVLLATERTTLDALLPHAKPGRFELAEARHLATVFTALREELGMSERGRDFAAVASLPGNPEADRWADLARLERDYRRVLRARGREDRNDARVAAATGSHLPTEFKRIWLAGLTDPQPLFIKTLERMEAALPIHVIIGAPEDEPGFDRWGRPDPAVWRERTSRWENFAQSVHGVRDPDEALVLLRSLLGAAKPDGDLHAVCACDREIEAPRIAAVIRSLGGEALNTLGQAHGDHLLHHGLKRWARLVGSTDPDFALVRAAMHLPSLAAAVRGVAHSAREQDRAFHHINTCLDAVDRAFLRGSLGTIIAQIAALPPADDSDPRRAAERRRLAEAHQVLVQIWDFLAALRGLDWEKALARGITLLIGPRELRGDDLADRFTREVADHVIATARTIAAAAGERELTLTTESLITLTLGTAAEKRFRESDVDHAVNLPGWFEAPWDPAPHLILHGFNDHLLPRSDHAHPFLPGQLRALVGLPSNDDTFASAAFALEQIRRRRESGGWLDLIVPQNDADGNPLRPSRLLFLAPDEQLPARVTQLFSPAPESGLQPYWEIPAGQRFVPLAEATRAQRAVTQIHATAFKDYLADPAEFWLKHAVGLSDQDHGRIELDAAGFGSLIHGALEGFGREFIGQTLTEASAIEDALLRHLDDHLQRTWGQNITAAVQLQAKAARARLRAFAPVQLALFTEGWLIHAVEQSLPTLTLNGIEIRGRYDRLDRHRDHGTWRVFDYKTFSRHTNPVRTHLRHAQDHESFTSRLAKRNAKGVITGEQVRRWKDLQLPIYHHALAPHLRTPAGTSAETPSLEIGYLCLPAQSSEAAVELWENYEADYRAAAVATLETVTAQLQAGGAGAFQPSERGSDYPLLTAMASRPMADYLNVTQLGGVLP